MASSESAAFAHLAGRPAPWFQFNSPSHPQSPADPGGHPEIVAPCCMYVLSSFAPSLTPKEKSLDQGGGCSHAAGFEEVGLVKNCPCVRSPLHGQLAEKRNSEGEHLVVGRRKEEEFQTLVARPLTE